MHVRYPVSFLVMSLVFALSAAGQSPPDLQAILSGAAEKRLTYINEFKNLLSQETKSFEIFGKKGDVKKRRSVVSTFIVYPLSTKQDVVTEFRNVISVDGKRVDNSEKRAQDFFEEIAKADSSTKELDKIDKEGSRYDEEVSVTGLTLFQAVVLADNLRPYFDFKLDGTETLNGRTLHRISYRQTKESPFVLLDPKRPVANGKLTLVYDLDLDDPERIAPRLSGTFWIDVDTLRVRKEKRILSIQRLGESDLKTAIETTLEYDDSTFDILIPKKLAFTQYEVGGKAQNARKDVSILFEYSNFTKPDVEVKSADIKN